MFLTRHDQKQFYFNALGVTAESVQAIANDIHPEEPDEGVEEGADEDSDDESVVIKKRDVKVTINRSTGVPDGYDFIQDVLMANTAEQEIVSGNRKNAALRELPFRRRARTAGLQAGDGVRAKKERHRREQAAEADSEREAPHPISRRNTGVVGFERLR